MTARRGSTLVELIVTLVIMAIVASVVTLALKPRASSAQDTATRVAEARRTALAQRRAVTITLVLDRTPVSLTALPDGGVVADSSLRLDRLTGEGIDARP